MSNENLPKCILQLHYKKEERGNLLNPEEDAALLCH
jgi:hypothetical protein